MHRSLVPADDIEKHQQGGIDDFLAARQNEVIEAENRRVAADRDVTLLLGLDAVPVQIPERTDRGEMRQFAEGPHRLHGSFSGCFLGLIAASYFLDQGDVDHALIGIVGNQIVLHAIPELSRFYL